MFGLWVKNSIPTKEGWYRVKVDGEETTGLFIRYDGKYRWLGCNAFFKDPKEVEWMPASYYSVGDIVNEVAMMASHDSIGGVVDYAMIRRPRRV